MSLREYGFYPTVEVIADDAFAYKVALQHDLSDNQMVYASYTTATKAGGNNPVIGTEADPYDQEETGVFEVGTKSILMDGAVLFNASFFMNDTKGMLISNIEDAGSVNYNVDAEIKGFEGNMVAFLSETSSIDISWLLVESELGDQTMPDPLNPAGIVALLDVDPTAFTPGVVVQQQQVFVDRLLLVQVLMDCHLTLKVQSNTVMVLMLMVM